MIKNLLWLVTFFIVGLASCSTQKKPAYSVTSTDTNNALTKDSIEYYETEFEVRQKNYIELLRGQWQIDTMHRQSRLPGENLTGVYINFNSDSTFNGKAGCNNIAGTYTLKGTSIRFSNIISTKMACEKLEQENAFLQLLQNTVSAYTVDAQSLWLRDGASNIIFHASKK
jgi:heat shock protein HslJ